MGSVLFSRKMMIVLVLGFSSGLPLGLTGSGAAFQGWLRTEGVDLSTIGIFGLVGIPYTLKFLWSPFMDRYVPPFLGRRRGWVLMMQLALAATLAVMAFAGPVAHPGFFALLAFLVAFFGASQDISADAYRTDVLEGKELGPGASIYVMGYRAAMIWSGAVSLILADQMPWSMVYLIMAASMGIGVLATFAAPEPAAVSPPKSMTEAVVLPFKEFFSRPGAIEILLFAILYKVDVYLGIALQTPFMMDLGFTKTEIGAVTKGFGLFATIIGVAIGGTWMVKLGVYRALWIFGIAQGVSNATFWFLARAGRDYPLMVASITIESLCSGLGTAAFAAFLMSICDKRFTATQYALLSSLFAVARVFLNPFAGYMAQNWGWENYFIVATLSTVPGVILLVRYNRWHRPNTANAAQ